MSIVMTKDKSFFFNVLYALHQHFRKGGLKNTKPYNHLDDLENKNDSGFSTSIRWLLFE